MTLKEILDAVSLQSGLSTETTYTGTGDDRIERLVSLANNEVQKMSRYPWQALRKVYQFTLSSATSYSLPTDWRAFVQDTMYTDSHLWAVNFPTDQGEWAYLQASTGGTGTKTQLRMIGDNLEVYQPTAGELIRVEYWSKHPVLSASEVPKQYFTADDDTFVLDDDLLTMRLIARYKRLLGLADWQVDMAEAERLEHTIKGTEKGAQTIRPEVDALGEPYYDLWRPVPNVY